MPAEGQSCEPVTVRGESGAVFEAESRCSCFPQRPGSPRGQRVCVQPLGSRTLPTSVFTTVRDDFCGASEKNNV